MTHLNEMKNFIQVVGNHDIQEIPDIVIDDLDDFDENEGILEQISHIIFELERFYIPDQNDDFNNGLTEGISMAINLLTSILDMNGK